MKKCKVSIKWKMVPNNHPFQVLFFIIVSSQILVNSVIAAEFYRIQHESSMDYTITKSVPVPTLTSCVMECSASSNICNKTEIETKENGQKVCHLLHKKQQIGSESKELSNEKSSESARRRILDDKSFILSSDFSDRPISDNNTFGREEPVYIKGWVLQKRNVCYDNENQLKTKWFKATHSGNVTQVRLVHVNGFVQGLAGSLKVYWGYAGPSADCAKEQCFGTIIVTSNNEMIFPHNIKMTQYLNFNLEGFFDPKSTYITMSRGTSKPYTVKKDEEFQVILGAKFSKEDYTYYAGQHCVDVFFHFDSDFPVRPTSNSCPFHRGESLYIKGWVLQKQNVCYDNEKILKTAWFNAIQAGSITKVKLVHVQGFLQGLSKSLKVYWGAVDPSDDCAKDNCFGTIIVSSKNEIVFPHNIEMTAYYNFNLKDFTDPKSPYITMSRETSKPYMVKRNEEFLVIIGAKYKLDLNYHAGKHCVDVFFYFD